MPRPVAFLPSLVGFSQRLLVSDPVDLLLPVAHGRTLFVCLTFIALYADVFTKLPQVLLILYVSYLWVVCCLLCIAGATLSRAFLGVRMYRWMAKLLQHPACCMSQLGICAAAASVAAPIWRLWLLYWVAYSQLRPVAWSSRHNGWVK